MQGRKSDARGLDNSGNIEGNIHATTDCTSLDEISSASPSSPVYRRAGRQPEDGLKRVGLESGLALMGQFTEHHGRLIQGELELMELLERQIAELDEQIR
jgi:hypothetical protein